MARDCAIDILGSFRRARKNTIFPGLRRKGPRLPIGFICTKRRDESLPIWVSACRSTEWCTVARWGQERWRSRSGAVSSAGFPTSVSSPSPCRSSPTSKTGWRTRPSQWSSCSGRRWWTREREPGRYSEPRTRSSCCLPPRRTPWRRRRRPPTSGQRQGWRSRSGSGGCWRGNRGTWWGISPRKLSACYKGPVRRYQIVCIYSGNKMGHIKSMEVMRNKPITLPAFSQWYCLKKWILSMLLQFTIKNAWWGSNSWNVRPAHL